MNYVSICSEPSNLTNCYIKRYIVKSHKQDLIDEEKFRIYREEQEEQRLAKELCYNSGYNFNKTFDISVDYGFSCKKLEYINDHLIDNTRKLSSGYIEGYNRGFFSYGYINGEFNQYVTERILATENLIQSIKYHIDCNGDKSEEEVIYYTEGDAVMYYVNNCLL
jgi:hypothetical protein